MYYIAKPNDYNSLKKNAEFINMLYEIKYLRINGISSIKEHSIAIERLIIDIEVETKDRQ